MISLLNRIAVSFILISSTLLCEAQEHYIKIDSTESLVTLEGNKDNYIIGLNNRHGYWHCIFDNGKLTSIDYNTKNIQFKENDIVIENLSIDSLVKNKQYKVLSSINVWNNLTVSLYPSCSTSITEIDHIIVEENLDSLALIKIDYINGKPNGTVTVFSSSQSSEIKFNKQLYFIQSPVLIIKQDNDNLFIGFRVWYKNFLLKYKKKWMLGDKSFKIKKKYIYHSLKVKPIVFPHEVNYDFTENILHIDWSIPPK